MRKKHDWIFGTACALLFIQTSGLLDATGAVGQRVGDTILPVDPAQEEQLDRVIHERLVEDGLLPPDGDDYIGPVGHVTDGVYTPNEHGLLDYERYRDRRASDDEDESVDPFEQQVITAGNDVLEYASYAMEDTDVSFDHVLKLDASSLYRKGADLSGGLDATVAPGGFAELKVYAYDQHEAKHLIYHLNLGPGEGVAGEFRSGTLPTERIKIHPDDATAHHEVKGNDIKQLMQRVDEAYHLSKEDLEAFVRKENAARAHYDSTHTRERRGFWGKVFGFAVTVVGVAAVGAGIVLAAPTFGLSTGLSVAGGALVGAGVGVVAGATIGVQAGDRLGDLVTSHDEKVPVHSSPHKEVFAEVEKDRRVHPMGTYPVQVVLRLKNASFYRAKVPGVGAPITANYFTVTNAYSPQHLNSIVADSYWSNEMNFEGGVQAIPSAGSYPYQASRFTYDNLAHLHLTVNPGTDHASEHTSFSSAIDLKLGDAILLEWVVPLAAGVNFDASNLNHYPSLSGFPYAWRAFFGGEVTYQCESSIQPGGWRPWLGYDSQVHGLAVRKYPNGYHKKFNPWEAHLANNGTHVVYRWATRVTRRMAVDALDPMQSPEHVWNKQKTSPVTQRNNQKEGLNMEIMKLLRDHSQASGSTPDFAVYSGPEFLSGFDPDEFLYIHNPQSGAVDGIYKIYDEPWKTVPEGEANNPINDLVSAYVKNRMWHIDSVDYRTVHHYGSDYQADSYEIQDISTSVDNPDGNGSGNRTAPGLIRITPPSAIAKTTVASATIRLNATPALNPDEGFYGCISGAVFSPSQWEAGVPYTASGLLEDEIDNYAIVLTKEDHFGRRSQIEYKSVNAPQHIRDIITASGNWTILVPSFAGFGYYSIELWHKKNDYWTRIGGRELVPDSLRFYSVPGSLGPNGGFAGVDLKESPGDALYVYIEEYLDEQNADWADWHVNGRYAKFRSRDYVVKVGETLTFEVQDADPHLFAHRGTEWYLSERRQAKQLQEDYLEGTIRHYMEAIRENGQTIKDRVVDGRGSRISHTFNTAGRFQLMATYRGVSKVAHQITVIDPQERSEGMQADVSSRALSEKEFNWLRASGLSIGAGEEANWKLLSIEDLYSKYRYVDGPRAHSNARQNNRFHPGNNYADAYRWKLTTHTGSAAVYEDYDLADTSHAPNGLRNILLNFNDADGWRPSIYLRHTSETNEEGEPLPNDINGSSVASFENLAEAHKQRVRDIMAAAPEAWQIRLPWISFVKDPSPYETDDFYSYRTRTNIKPIYDTSSLFNPQTGIFSGNPTTQVRADSTSEELLNLGVYLHLIDDDLKLKRRFMQDLCTGRSIIVPANIKQAKVSNVKDTASSVLGVYSSS